MSLVRRYAKRKRRPESERKAFVAVWDKLTPPRNMAGRDSSGAGFVQSHGGEASESGASDAHILTSLTSSETQNGLQLLALWKRRGGEKTVPVICSSQEMLLYAYPKHLVREAIRHVGSPTSGFRRYYPPSLVEASIWLKAPLSSFQTRKNYNSKENTQKRLERVRQRKGAGGYSRLKSCRAVTVEARNTGRLAPTYVQAKDSQGDVLFRTNALVVSLRPGRNCCLDAFDFATGEPHSVTRKSLCAPGTGDISIRQVAQYLRSHRGKWKIACLQGKPAFMKLSAVLALKKGIVIARARTVVQNKGEKNGYHYVAYDSFRQIFFAGGWGGAVKLTDAEQGNLDLTALALQKEFCFLGVVDNVRIVKVNYLRVRETKYNTPNDYL